MGEKLSHLIGCTPEQGASLLFFFLLLVVLFQGPCRGLFGGGEELLFFFLLLVILFCYPLIGGLWGC
ncbi:MAG: hypothetical protein AB2421_13930 [Thermotaleaceae bacterium]